MATYGVLDWCVNIMVAQQQIDFMYQFIYQWPFYQIIDDVIEFK